MGAVFRLHERALQGWDWRGGGDWALQFAFGWWEGKRAYVYGRGSEMRREEEVVRRLVK